MFSIKLLEIQVFLAALLLAGALVFLISFIPSSSTDSQVAVDSVKVSDDRRLPEDRFQVSRQYGRNRANVNR